MSVLNTKIVRVYLLLGFLCINLSCGDRKDREGVFLDSAVEGLRYSTDSFDGFTNVNGTFSYRDGETVSFYLGDLLLGSAAGAAQLTPLDLVADATAVTNNQVTNIARLLQTLDENFNTDDGILLPAVVNTTDSSTINLNQSIQDFGSDRNVESYVTIVVGVPRNLKDITEAQDHLQETINGSTASSLTVSAGTDQTVTSDDVVTLTATITGSSIGFGWARDANNSIDVEIIFGNASNSDDVSNEQIRFTAPGVSVATELNFILTATRTNGTAISDTVKVTVNPS